MPDKRFFIKHKAFTISELLIALGVIAVLTAVLMPIVHSLIPDQNTLMAKRAFYTTETVISSMINDPGCYPVIRARVGFADGNGYLKCPKWGNGRGDNAKSKFVTLFTDKLDIKGNVQNSGSSVKFETKDGMYWNFSSIVFSGTASKAVLTIDVNGTVKGPNCGQASESGSCTPARSNGYDKFTMYILPTGKIKLVDCWAIKSVRTDKKLIGQIDDFSNCAEE